MIKNYERGDGVKRQIIIIVLMIAAVLAIAYSRLPAPSFQADIASAADLGLLLDTDEDISVLGVQDKSIAEQMGIHPEDVLLHITCPFHLFGNPQDMVIPEHEQEPEHYVNITRKLFEQSRTDPINR